MVAGLRSGPLTRTHLEPLGLLLYETMGLEEIPIEELEEGAALIRTPAL